MASQAVRATRSAVSRSASASRRSRRSCTRARCASAPSFLVSSALLAATRRDLSCSCLSPWPAPTPLPMHRGIRVALLPRLVALFCQPLDLRAVGAL